MKKREMTRPVQVGSYQLGGQNKVLIQSMTNTKTHDVQATVNQILALEKAGCEIVRMAVLDEADALAIKEIKPQVHVPLVADIHFNHRLALIALDGGIDKIRINPGNIGAKENVMAVVKKCQEKNVPIRIGINSGSLEKELLEKYGKPCADAMIESARKHVEILEECGFYDIVLSFKSSDVQLTIEAYQKAAEVFPYPLHLGVTEAGTFTSSSIKSSAALGTLLSQGIGDTIRVSLTDNPIEEIKAAKDILKAVGLKTGGVNIVSCPTCGRTKIDLISLANKVEKALENCDKNITVAVMGCVVNGPGEAKEADIGIAGGDGCGIIFKKGEILRKVSEKDLFDELMKEIKGM